MGGQRRHRPRVEGPSPGGIQEEKAQQAAVVEERQRQGGAPALGQQPAAVVRGRIQLPLEVMEHPGLLLIPQPAEGGNRGEGARFKVGLARPRLAIPARWPAVRARFAVGREQVGAGFVMHKGDPGDPQVVGLQPALHDPQQLPQWPLRNLQAWQGERSCQRPPRQAQ